MGRLGVAIDEVPRALEILRGSPRLRLAGLLSHFGDADDLGSPRNPAQEERFAAVLALLTAEEREGVADPHGQQRRRPAPAGEPLSPWCGSASRSTASTPSMRPDPQPP